ncbi:MAG: undecaprenyl-diphosphatase UppP [Micrococcales bacterium 73-13]|nr:MAG: undecaprenyl-diphosphatase UppP [Micrococcales bacterium 73-13]
MSFIEAAILGLIQGLTEFLPISSSAHLRIAGEFFGHDPGATFTAITQIGTEVAVVLYFWKDIVRIVGRWFRHFAPGSGIRRGDPDVRLAWLIIIGTIPIGLVGYLAQAEIRGVFRSLWLVATVLIVFGLLLGIADWLGHRRRELDHMTYPHGLLIGLAQMLALVPGVSRSGATTATGLALGYTRPAAARFAFLLAIPAVLGSGVYELVNALRGKGDAGAGAVVMPFGLAETALATIVAFVVGYAVIAFLMRWLQTRSFLPFVVYRVLLGGVIMVLLATNVLQPY